MTPPETGKPGSSRPELIVVGAGVIGAAVAFELTRAGRAFLWIAPFDDPAGTATGAAGAMLGALGEIEHEPRTAAEDCEMNFRLAAADRYQGWLAEISAAGGSAPDLKFGTFIVGGARRIGDRIALDGIEAVAGRLNRPCERADPADVPGLSPAPSFEPERVIFLPAEGFVDARALRTALGDAAGVRPMDDAVARLLVQSDRVVGVETLRHGSFEADEVVLCAGTGTQQLLESLRPLAARVPEILRSKGVSLVLKRPSSRRTTYEHVLRTPNREFACGLHVVPQSEAALYVGATNRVSRLPDVTGELTASDALYLLDGVTKEFSTDLEQWNISSSSFGHRPLSVDGWPIAGRTDVPGLSIGTGTYRNGVLLAPLIAEIVVSELERGPGDPTNRLSPLSPERPAPPPDVLRSGLREMALLIDDAGASWWRGQLDEVFGALGMLAGTDERAHELRANVAALLERYPRPEMVPEALVELLQQIREE